MEVIEDECAINGSVWHSQRADRKTLNFDIAIKAVCLDNVAIRKRKARNIEALIL